MAKRIERNPSEVRAELQAWYLADLRPKLASAARSGKVMPGAVVTLDAQLRQLLDVGGNRLGEAA